MPNPIEARSAAREPKQNSVSPLAGKPAPKELLVDVARLEREYFDRRPDLQDPNQLVIFGTSGHRGSPFRHIHRSPHRCYHAGNLRLPAIARNGRSALYG